jgi:ubiquinone/menaquinone biosynthesis C-methylase UbiE
LEHHGNSSSRKTSIKRKETMSHFHQHLHSTEQTPETKGNVIHWALSYDVMSNPILRRSEASIHTLAQVKPGSKVLDVGCGSGRLTMAAQKIGGT